MKIKIILLSFSIFFVTGIGFAQKKNEPQSIISEGVAIKKYHNIDELERMQKGELLTLYIERIEALTRVLPYIAFATKPGVTMSTLGIPNDKDNRKVLENQFEATDDYLKSTVEFQKIILPYSDTNKLIAAILFYEETMKSLHQYSEFH
ncbi:hypothetical protein GCM10007962_27750 [Yeosuana aromativorans]|jgi:hypothetical protein|uniref:Uncharacterized protein n=1 Tax=Yeosuana aromativorans TaxID=288019 RepID=A0A8J3BSC9_9FLAO|nr:hypothetical protein [Yeosuana aromativorans]GGK31866.1 hypothetical protein GCM10007962_27750 [Yeosuana aromativorans]